MAKDESKSNKHHGRGSSTLELVIAFVVVTLALTAAIMIVFGNQAVTVDSELAEQALDKTTKQLEIARARGQEDYLSVTTTPTIREDGLFDRRLEVLDITPCVKRITSLTSYAAESRDQSTRLVSRLTDPTAPSAFGESCSGNEPAPDDWRNPAILAARNLNPNEGVVTSLDIVDGLVYLSVFSPDNEKDDFWIIDARGTTPGATPPILARLDTGSKPCPPHCDPGLYALDTAGGYAYTASASTTAQFQIIGIANPAAPVVVAKRKLAGVNPTGSFPEGRSIFYYDQRVYLGTWETAGPEFHIFDIRDPFNPIELGNYNLGHSVNAISVRRQTIGGISKTIAFVANSATNSAEPELSVLDATNPASVTVIGSFNAAGTREGQSLYVLGSRLYLGRADGTDAYPNFYVLDISDPTDIKELGHTNIKPGPPNDTVNALWVTSDLAFIGTDISNEEFQIWNVTDPTNIYQWNAGCVFNFPQAVSGLELEDNLIYAASRGPEALRIIRPMDPDSTCSP